MYRIITIVKRLPVRSQKRIIVSNLTKWVCEIAFLFASWNNARRHQRHRCSYRGTERGVDKYTYVHTHESTHERVRGWLLASLSFFLVFLPGPRGDACWLQGTVARAHPLPLVVCDSEIPFGQEVEEKENKKHRRWKEEELLVNEKIPRVFGKTRSPLGSSLSPTIVAGIRIVNRYDPRIFGERDSTIWAYLVNLLSLHFINVLSRIFFFYYKCWLIESSLFLFLTKKCFKVSKI